MSRLQMLVLSSTVFLAVVGNAEAQQPSAPTAPTCTHMDECFQEWSCRLPPRVPRLPGSTIVRPGFSISDDGKGPYLEGPDSSLSYVRAAVTFHATAPKVSAASARRFLRIDLSRPVEPGTPSLGIIEDKYADFHAWGPTLARNGIEPVIQYLRVGSTWTSALVHIDFTHGGRYYLLHLGPEALGEGCNGGGTALYGTGTTAVTMSRPAHNVYIADAPSGSIARLFDITNKLAGAVNKGLYYVSFQIVFEARQ